MKNAKMNEFTSSKYKISSSSPLWVWKEEKDEQRGYHEKRGIVSLPEGIVTFYQHHYLSEMDTSSRKEWKLTRIEFVYNGYEYSRRWEAFYGKKTITRLAKQFVKDVMEVKV